MIKEIRQIEEDWYLIHLEGTRHYQIWNKWDLFSLLLKETEINLKNPKPCVDFIDEDLPLSEEELKTIINNLKKIKQNASSKK
jgi:hypothetical protein